ncbi:PQ loop repeat-domain-containing protein [Pilobolus umbonatus]|nr:PQ loop repeat-domain-containing protein [Pilobolus umbonatus]
MSLWNITSDIIGWSYFIIWSISFYPQISLNYKRQSVRGLSIDYLLYNLLGFFCYSIYNIAFYYNNEIRDEYKQRHPHSNLVRFNDVIFSVHGFILSAIIVLQMSVYKKYDNQHISSFAASFIWLTCLGGMLVISAIYYGGVVWIDFMYYLSSLTLVVYFIKYVPQIWLNGKRKSTRGLSVEYIVWELIGGTLSIVQLLLDAYIKQDWTGIEGDNVKLGIGIIVVCCDITVLIQHYIYRPRILFDYDIYQNQEEQRLLDESMFNTDDEASMFNYGSVHS